MVKTDCNHTERPFRCLLKEALYIGVVGYGGPAVLALAKQRLVHEKHIIEEKDFMDALALSQVLPGAIGVTLMGRIGYQAKELWGAILVPAVFALPSLVFITALSWAYFRFGDLPFVKSLFTGLGALVVALLANASILIGKSVFGKITFKNYKGILISMFTFTGIYMLHFNVLWLILLSGLLGFLFFYFTGKFEDIPSQEGDTILPPQISMTSVAPQHRIKRYIPVIILFIIAGFICLLSPRAVEIANTFLKIGALGFGGGFTAIPLIKGVVVDQLHWVNEIQFRDGIALGQITPGPVFITAAFIGYHVAGIIGAFVAALAIFTPSVTAIVILSRMHGRVRSLKAVRVVIKGFLSGFFGLLIAVTLQFGFNSLIDWKTWAIFLVASMYLFFLKKDTIWLILGTMVVSLFLFRLP